MKVLNTEQQERLGIQMYNKARDIDVAVYNYLEESMPSDFIIDVLLSYIGKDGGIGSGLYIDNYNTNSSPYQVYEAYRLLDIAGVDINYEHEYYEYFVNKTMNYLYNKCEIKNNKWNPNVKSNNDFAHSILFDYNDDNTKLFGYAPTAALLGFTLLNCKPTKAYYKKALKMIDVMLKDFYNMEYLSKYEFISFNSFLSSIKKANVLVEEHNKIEAKLTELALKQVSLKFDNLSEVHPLDCALHLSNNELNEKIELQLDYIIDNLKHHGLWEYEGSWGYNKYTEEDSAKMKWLGAVSVNNYYYLKKYNRLEK